jgi:histidinol-phosphate/aromatic aminotransferase/cobyric acid decarboxylase-like protein
MTYERPAEHAGALRLHLNENTGGCSAAVIEAIRRISAEDVAYYPDYSALSRECADYLGVREAQLLLTNGLDEGLLALTVNAFQHHADRRRAARAIVPIRRSRYLRSWRRAVCDPAKAGFMFQA